MTARRLLSGRLLVLVAGALGPWAHAEPGNGAHPGDGAEQVTVTATRLPTDINEVPATVSVITHEQIEEQLAQNIQDLIRYEPGVSVRASPARFTAALGSTGRDGNSGFNIRGLEGNRVLIQVDGVRVPEAFSFGAQAVGRGDYVDLDILKSVEIVRGPASALYGSDGLAGSVSFITKDPGDVLREDQSLALLGSVSYASADDGYAESVLGAGRFGQWEALVSYTRRDGEGQETRGDNNSANTDRTTANPEDNHSNSALAKLIFAPNDANRLRLTWDHLDRHVGYNVLSAIAKPPLGATSTLALSAADSARRDRVTLDHDFRPSSPWLESLHSAIYLQDSTTDQLSAEDRNISADRRRDNTFDNRVAGAMVEAVSRIDGWIGQRWVYGADYSRTRQEGVRNGTVPPVGETFPTRAFPTTDYTLAGIFIQDELSIADGRIELYPAVRWDHYQIDPKPDALFVASAPASQSDSRVSPKIGAIAKLTENVSVFVNAATGFEAPSPSEVNNGFVNLIANYTSIANPNLKPETSRTVEGGVRVHGEDWSAGVTGFTGRYKDFIEQAQLGGSFSPTDPGIFQFVNLQNVRIRGVEARGRVEVAAGFAFSASAAYSRGEYDSEGVEAPLESIDPWKAVAGIDWKPASGRFGAQLNTTYSHGKEPDRAGVTCTPSCFLPPSFTLLDVLGWWRITDQLTVRGGVFNVTDQKYWSWSDVRGVASNSPARDGYSQPGTNFTVSLSYRL